MGFSAGGIQAGEFLMHYDEDVNGTALDSSYVPDELDQIPAHASADGMIYSFYGRLSVGNMDPETGFQKEIFLLRSMYTVLKIHFMISLRNSMMCSKIWASRPAGLS